MNIKCMEMKQKD